MTTASKQMISFGLINLGCAKNKVDSEGLLAGMAMAGFVFCPDPLQADVCIVNTCGFLDESRREAAGVLQELAERRRRKKHPFLIATGCLVERAGGTSELEVFLQDADARVGFSDYPILPDICTRMLAGESVHSAARGYAGRVLPASYVQWLNQPRMRIGETHSAYLKIGEGCSNCCSYCSIPLIRGARVSRKPGDILKEARELVDSGVRELNLIAQDTTAYGADGKNEASQFADLLRRLLRMPDDIWFRVLYAHPRHLTDDILRVMASDPRVCPYVDLPLQHISDPVLKAMGRGYTRRHVEKLLEKIRSRLPDAALRTTYILGHPGEGGAEFEELLAFVESHPFDHVGVFVFSPEPETPSATMTEAFVPLRTARRRAKELMAAQANVSSRLLRQRVGTETDVLLETPTSSGWIGRTPWQAPDVDGRTRVTGSKFRQAKWKAGDRIHVRISNAGIYDLTARILSSS